MQKIMRYENHAARSIYGLKFTPARGLISTQAKKFGNPAILM
jgi:hypothetical protein